MDTFRVISCIVWTVLLAPAASARAEHSLAHPLYISTRTGPQHLSLSGEWQLAYQDLPVAGPRELMQVSRWIPAHVPDSVQWSLYAAGELPHPYHHLNSQKYTWVPEKVWYYRRHFDLPAEAGRQYVFLCFDGVGYYSRIWLNGELLGQHEGMFGGPAVEVGQLVRSDRPNELVVEVRAPSHGMPNWDDKSLQHVIVSWGIGGGNPYVTGNSGIGTKEFLPFGIWRDVRLEIVPRAHLERPFLVTTKAASSEARMKLTTEVMINTHSLEHQLHPSKGTMLGNFRNASTTRLARTRFDLQVRFFEKGAARPVLAQTFPLRVYEGRNWIEREIRMPSPKLWWPNGMGQPNLYRVNLTLIGNGQVFDALEVDFGIRTIEQRPSAGPRTQDRWAKWQFVVNGRPLFVKGVNWAWPMDILLHLPRERYSWQLEAALAAGIQMIRVWGGGNPETDDFYSLCNELGIMVWEDFPIGNTETRGWNQDAWEAQTLQIIFRYRNHPSLAVWCGGNEFNPYSAGNTAAIGVLERSLAEFDSSRVFLRATPDSGDIHVYPDMDPTWCGHDYRLVPFVSEIGIFDMCEPESIREVVDPRDLEGPLRGIFGKEFAASRPDFVHHFLQYTLVGPQKAMWGRASQVDDLSAPTLERLVDAARAGVGEFFQIASELLQANYPVTTGLMPWSFTVPWPIVFPACMDALDQATAMYYFLKRTYEPTHVLIRLPHLVWAKGEKVPISISVLQSAEMGLVGGKVSVEILDERFKRLWRQERAVLVKPGPSVNHVELGEFVIGPGLADHFFFLVAELRRSDERLLSRSVYWPRCLKVMEDTEFRARYRAVSRPSLVLDKGPWLRPQVAAMRTSLELEVSKHQDIGGGQTRLRVRVRNTGLQPAFLTQIDIRGTRRGSYGTDNFFWLGPGETRFLDFRVWWKDPATRGQAAVIATAWNADLKEVPLRTQR
jgi:beta-mannosidase